MLKCWETADSPQPKDIGAACVLRGRCRKGKIYRCEFMAVRVRRRERLIGPGTRSLRPAELQGPAPHVSQSFRCGLLFFVQSTWKPWEGSILCPQTLRGTRAPAGTRDDPNQLVTGNKR